jgi:UDPglucose--hexose-1-phosphate uridylyltransferase
VSIHLKSIQDSSTLLNPLHNFQREDVSFEVRRDPLTGETGRVFNLPYNNPERPDIKEIIKKSENMFCPFCPETLDSSTPMFPKELVPEGRIQVGDATLIPNFIPFDKYAAVSIMSKEHYIGIEDLTPQKMNDSFWAAILFIKRIIGFDPKADYFYVNWNYMPQSGSSLIHPHLQVNCGYTPTNYHKMQIEGCKKYEFENNSDFWQDFMVSEKEHGDRYIGETRCTFWVMSYVSQTFLPDIWCIFKKHHSFAEIDTGELLDFLEGLSKIFNYMAGERLFSFNISIYSIKNASNFRINAKICPRLLPRAIGNSDRSYLQVLHKEPYSVKPPESICPIVRSYFNEQNHKAV